MKICVLSDIHFKYIRSNPDDEANAGIVLSFLREAVGRYDLMVLNGDIFDLWYDWKYTIIKQYFPLLHRLAEIGEQGCKLVLISGNHDFWFNSFLGDYLQMEVHNDLYRLEADGKKMLFSHGDLYTVNDARYKIMRKLIRLKGVRQLFSLLHPDFSLLLGHKLSRSSRLRKVSSKLKRKKASGMQNYASRQLSRKNFDIVVMGHIHNPILKELAGGVYANCGDWMRHHSYLEIIDGKPELKTYKTKETQV